MDEALEMRGTDLATFVDSGRRQGKSVREIADDLQETTGVPLTYRTLYRWIGQLEEVAS